MAVIQWNDNLSVNVGEIDRQHQQLIKFINDLNQAMKEGKGKDVVGRTVNSLMDYTKTHFKLEEGYFDRFAYPEKLSHKKSHDDFVRKVGDFKKDLEEGRLALSIQVLNFLSDWLRDHIMGTDKKYASFFAEHGVK
jgi:hemerythrin